MPEYVLSTGARGVKFQGASTDSTSTPQRGKPITSDAFCKLISRRAQSQLMLRVSEEGLLHDGVGLFAQDFLLRSSSMPLAELLQVTTLDPKMGLLLSFTLAKSFWQFYGSDWMQGEWTKDTVHFMFQSTSTIPQGIMINEPFLAAKFGQDMHSNDEDGMRVHPFPNILALGIMLIEIELGIHLEDKYQPDSYDADGNPTVNANLMAALYCFDHELHNTYVPLKNAIKNCLQPQRFSEHRNDIESIRNLMMKLIVDSIQELYMVAWEEHPDKSSVSPIALSENDKNRRTNRYDSPSPPLETPVQSIDFSTEFRQQQQQQPFLDLKSQQAYPPSQTPVSQIQGAISEHTSGLSSDSWFQSLGTLNNVLRAKPREADASWRKSRVAILDTGVHEDLNESGGLVKEYKDFVDNDDQLWRDNVGHGTKAVHLTKKVYNMAEIYAARVFENSEASDNTEKLMAQAMHYAIDVWKTDVIVMPSGFRSYYREILEAVEKANRHRVLIFMAASNLGNATNISFPGRLYAYGKLFCMFSTDANARCLQRLNPSPSADARQSFAILGEKIVLHPCEPPLYGTSFSTIIAGALAARLLDFARQRGIRESLRCSDRLSKVEGMSAVFLHMAKGAVDNGYHCMTPWKILPDISVSDLTERRNRQRLYVSDTISRALENLY